MSIAADEQIVSIATNKIITTIATMQRVVADTTN